MGSMMCAGPNEAGRYNVTLRVHDPALGYGQARYSDDIKQVDTNGRIYHFTHVPKIESLSFSSSGLVGQQELVITGDGFAWNRENNTVLLAGVPCTVTSSSTTELRCKVGAAAESTNVTVSPRQGYVAGRGLLHRIYFNVFDSSNNEIASAPSNQFIDQSALYGLYE